MTWTKIYLITKTKFLKLPLIFNKGQNAETELHLTTSVREWKLIKTQISALRSSWAKTTKSQEIGTVKKKKILEVHQRKCTLNHYDSVSNEFCCYYWIFKTQVS